MLPFEVPRLATDQPVGVFPGFWKLPFFLTPFPGWISIPTSFVSLFYLLYFVLPPFEDSGLAAFLGDPMDCSLPGSSVHGIFQARVLE